MVSKWLIKQRLGVLFVFPTHQSQREFLPNISGAPRYVGITHASVPELALAITTLLRIDSLMLDKVNALSGPAFTYVAHLFRNLNSSSSRALKEIA